MYKVVLRWGRGAAMLPWVRAWCGGRVLSDAFVFVSRSRKSAEVGGRSYASKGPKLRCNC